MCTLHGYQLLAVAVSVADLTFTDQYHFIFPKRQKGIKTSISDSLESHQISTSKSLLVLQTGLLQANHHVLPLMVGICIRLRQVPTAC